MTTSILDNPRFRQLFERTRDQPRCERVARVSVEALSCFADEIAAPGYPVVLQGASEARSLAWLREVLARECGDIELNVRTGAYADPSVYFEARDSHVMRLREFIEHMQDAVASGRLPAYAGNNLASVELTEVLGVRPPPYYPPGMFREPKLWLGPAGTVTPLHKDTTDAFIYHVVGAKQWTCYPVRDSVHLHLRNYYEDPEMDFSVSEIDLRRPDLERFPALAKATPVDVTLAAGEMLYLPAGWSHFVISRAPTLTVNYRMDRRCSTPGVLATPAARSLSRSTS